MSGQQAAPPQAQGSIFTAAHINELAREIARKGGRGSLKLTRDFFLRRGYGREGLNRHIKLLADLYPERFARIGDVLIALQVGPVG